MKVGNLYNLASFDAMGKSPVAAAVYGAIQKAAGFNDAYTGTVLGRNLTAVDPQVFEKKFPELAFVGSGITADNTGGFAQVIQSLRVIEHGSFKTAGDTASNKGHISLSAEDSFLKVMERTAESNWTNTEVQQAALGNINLVSKYVAAQNAIYMREIDVAGYLGVPDVAGSKGLLNYAGFTSTAATGAIAALTAQQMYDDISGLIQAQKNAVNNTPEYTAVNVDMPIYVLNQLETKILNTAAGAASVLNALKANYPGVNFRGTFRADNAGGAGVSHTVAYSTNSESMKMRIPVPLTVGEIIKVGSFNFHMDSFYRVAGLDILEDTAGYILTGL